MTPPPTFSLLCDKNRLFRAGRLSRERKRALTARAMWYATSFTAHRTLCSGSEKELLLGRKGRSHFGLDFDNSGMP